MSFFWSKKVEHVKVHTPQMQTLLNGPGINLPTTLPAAFIAASSNAPVYPIEAGVTLPLNVTLEDVIAAGMRPVSCGRPMVTQWNPDNAFKRFPGTANVDCWYGTTDELMTDWLRANVGHQVPLDACNFERYSCGSESVDMYNKGQYSSSKRISLAAHKHRQPERVWCRSCFTSWHGFEAENAVREWRVREHKAHEVVRRRDEQIDFNRFMEFGRIEREFYASLVDKQIHALALIRQIDHYEMNWNNQRTTLTFEQFAQLERFFDSHKMHPSREYSGSTLHIRL